MIMDNTDIEKFRQALDVLIALATKSNDENTITFIRVCTELEIIYHTMLLKRG